MCTHAYREALIRDFSAAPSPAPASGQRQAAEPSREGLVGRPLQHPGLDDLEAAAPGPQVR
jgi:hypothetical protein